MNQYLVTVQDFSDTECINRRLAVRESHLSGALALKNSNILVSGGAIISEAGGMCGSFLILNFDSSEEIIPALSKDIYATNKVWDLSTASIIQIKVAPL